MKVNNIQELQENVTESEWIIIDVIRGILKENLPDYCNEKISYNVPFFYGNKGICIIWPASIPRGGVKDGVLLGFWQGNKLVDPNNYLSRGTNKKVFYKIYKDIQNIDVQAIETLLKEAIQIDKMS